MSISMYNVFALGALVQEIFNFEDRKCNFFNGQNLIKSLFLLQRMETSFNLPRDDKTVGRDDKTTFVLNFNDPAALI